jgi:hypothetical protein
MLCCRIFLAASLCVILVVAGGLAAETPQKQPRAGDDPKIPAQDWYKVAVLCTSPEFPENRSL